MKTKAFTFCIIAAFISGISGYLIYGSKNRQLPGTIPIKERLKVTGYFSVGTDTNTVNTDCVWGSVSLKMNGKYYGKATVMLGSKKVHQANSIGVYQFDDLIPVSNQVIQLTITYPSIHSGKIHTITIEGIYTGPGIRITNPDKSVFSPFVHPKFNFTWSGTFGQQTVFFKNLTDNTAALVLSHPRGTSLIVDSSIFESGKKYKFFYFGKKYLKIKGPVARGSEFYTEIQGVCLSTCIGRKYSKNP